MHVYDKERMYKGYPAIVRIARLIPPLWPLLPLLYIGKWLKFGDIIYNIIAKSRTITSCQTCDHQCSPND